MLVNFFIDFQMCVIGDCVCDCFHAFLFVMFVCVLSTCHVGVHVYFSVHRDPTYSSHHILPSVATTRTPEGAEGGAPSSSSSSSIISLCVCAEMCFFHICECVSRMCNPSLAHPWEQVWVCLLIR